MLVPAPAASTRMTVGLHRVWLLKDGREVFPAMLDDLSAARSSICLETYILRDDSTGQRFAEVLMERARAGVEVNLLYDAWGSSVPESLRIRLEEAGVRVLAYHPLLQGKFGQILTRLTRRNHRKSQIVDSAAAFVGGLNIADDYASVEDGGAGWRDTAVRLEGPAARELQLIFLLTWRRHGGAPLDKGRYVSAARRLDPRVRVITSDRHRDRKSIRKAYRVAIAAARKTIHITSAYFLPTGHILRPLMRAARRGVEVKVILAGNTDVKIVLFAARALYERLLRAGVRIFEWHGANVLHAKSAVIDRHWATVGSSNLDVLSLIRNLEVDAVIEDPGFAAQVEDLFEQDLVFCQEITLADLRRWPWYKRLLSRLAYLFRNWL